MKTTELTHDRIKIVCRFVGKREDEVEMCDAPSHSRMACKEWNCPLFRNEPTGEEK